MEFNDKVKQSNVLIFFKENLVVGIDISCSIRDLIAEELIPSYIKEMYPLVRALR